MHTITSNENFNRRGICALAAIKEAQDALYRAEAKARETLKVILRPVGEHGVSVTPLGLCCDDEENFAVVAEPVPGEFFPVTLVRFWQGKLEVFLSNWENRPDGSRYVCSDGKWKPYEESHVDTLFLLKKVAVELEWADWYDDNTPPAKDNLYRTGRGTEVYLAFVPDVDPNKGGWYVEIYLNESGDRYDDFCIHPGDCDCTNDLEVQEYARKYVESIKEY